MDEPMITIPLSTFHEMLDALDAAIAFRTDQLVKEKIDSPFYDGWSNDFSRWNDLKKLFSRNGKEA